MRTRQAIVFLVLLGAAVCRMAAAEDEASVRQDVLVGARDATIKYYTDREFKIDGEQLKGTLQAVDPQKYVTIEIKEFKFGANHIETTFRTEGRFGFDGKLTANGKKSDLKATVDIRQDVEMVVDYEVVDGRLSIDARVTEAKFHVDLVKMDPGDVPGGATLVREVAEKEIERQKADRIKEFNDWLAEQYL